MEINKHTILSENVSYARTKVEKINKRARKLGVPEITFAVVEGSEKFVKSLDGSAYKVVDVEVSAEPVKLAGWRFAATLQHTDEGNIVRRVPTFEGELDLTQYREVEPWCDHCQKIRRRNDTYIVVSDEGSTKQVGSSCLKDFLGYDPTSALWMAQVMIDFEGLVDEWGYFGDREPNFFNVEDYLAWVSASIRDRGWVSRSKAKDEDSTATADDATWVWFWKGKGPRPFTPVEKDYEIAKKALEWIRNYENPVEANDYIYNLYVASKSNYITYREFGIVASLIQAYNRAMEQEIARSRQTQVSEWVGEVGERREFTLKVESVRYSDGMYGVTYITTLSDEDGNIFVWFASNKLEAGATYTGKATIKKHDEFRGVKQTVITRGKFEKVG